MNRSKSCTGSTDAGEDHIYNKYRNIKTCNEKGRKASRHSSHEYETLVYQAGTRAGASEVRERKCFISQVIIARFRVTECIELLICHYY